MVVLIVNSILLVFNGGVNTIELDKQGNIYVGGIFISYKYNKNIIIECNKLIKLKIKWSYI